MTYDARLLVIEHEADCPPGILAILAASTRVTLDVCRPYLGDTLPSLSGSGDAFHGVVILGGGMGPLEGEEHPWLPACKQLSVDATRTGVPLLGVCLGEEILGAALDAPISRREKPEIGMTRVIPTHAAATDPLFSKAGVTAPFEAFQWHQEQVASLPQSTKAGDCTILAVNDAGDIEAFRAGTASWGVQFHPEITGNIASAWARTSTLTPPGRDPESYELEVESSQDELARSKALLQAFLEICTERAAAP